MKPHCCLKGMNFKQGISREQISMVSPECFIASDNPVRVIDMFVEQLDLRELGFTKTTLSKEGRPPYEAKYLLKLYFLYNSVGTDYLHMNHVLFQRLLFVGTGLWVMCFSACSFTHNFIF